jgi:uncharacterized protein (DUF433 family)
LEMTKPVILDGVKVVRSILHSHYYVADVGYDTKVSGVSTWAVADLFRGEGSIAKVAHWYGLEPWDVEAALRWELHDRRWRVERVREVVAAEAARVAEKGAS